MPAKGLLSRHTLVCFDAFGTLFRPTTSIEHQYTEVARTLGLLDINENDVGRAFLKAFKHESKENPNYGSATQLGAEKWWTNIINNTFNSVTHQELPKDLAPRLIHRFHSKDGYTIYPDVKQCLDKIRAWSKKHEHTILIGVITNSDDRVPDILKDLGLRVHDVRCGDVLQQNHACNAEYDIDFSIMSYDAGHEKPDRRIFDQALLTVDNIAAAKFGRPDLPPAQTWNKIYIGDEYKKDVVGALSAGWQAALVERNLSIPLDNVAEPMPGISLFEAFEQSQALGFRSLQALSEHIPE